MVSDTQRDLGSITAQYDIESNRLEKDLPPANEDTVISKHAEPLKYDEPKYAAPKDKIPKGEEPKEEAPKNETPLDKVPKDMAPSVELQSDEKSTDKVLDKILLNEASDAKESDDETPEKEAPIYEEPTNEAPGNEIRHNETHSAEVPKYEEPAVTPETPGSEDWTVVGPKGKSKRPPPGPSKLSKQETKQVAEAQKKDQEKASGTKETVGPVDSFNKQDDKPQGKAQPPQKSPKVPEHERNKKLKGKSPIRPALEFNPPRGPKAEASKDKGLKNVRPRVGTPRGKALKAEAPSKVRAVQGEGSENKVSEESLRGEETRGKGCSSLAENIASNDTAENQGLTRQDETSEDIPSEKKRRLSHQIQSVEEAGWQERLDVSREVRPCARGATRSDHSNEIINSTSRDLTLQPGDGEEETTTVQDAPENTAHVVRSTPSSPDRGRPRGTVRATNVEPSVDHGIEEVEDFKEDIARVPPPKNESTADGDKITQLPRHLGRFPTRKSIGERPERLLEALQRGVQGKSLKGDVNNLRAMALMKSHFGAHQNRLDAVEQKRRNQI